MRTVHQRFFLFLLSGSALLLHGAEARGATAAQEKERTPIPTEAKSATIDENASYLLRLCKEAYSQRHNTANAGKFYPAIEDALRQGVSAQEEDEDGYDALYYLNALHELYAQLKQKKLLPNELCVRLPRRSKGLLAYARLRGEQAAFAEDKESREYLRRRFLAPAYDRVYKLMLRYQEEENAALIPQEALPDLLLFLLMADEKRICSTIDGMSIWPHSEHFLEEKPLRFLRALHRLRWPVAPAMLYKAIEKLERMLPKSKSDLIDCNASAPLSLLLDLLYWQEGAKAQPLLEKLSKAYDPQTAYAARRILLQEKGLPLPDELPGDEAPAAEKLQRFYAAIKVDQALLSKQSDELMPAELQAAAETCQALGLSERAAMLKRIRHELFLSDESGDDEEMLLHEYQEIGGETPQSAAALYILEHPAEFRGNAAA